MTGSWSNRQDEILINFVRLHQVLYDVKHVNNRKSQLKKELWCKVGKILNKTGSECYKRWCCVRDYYIRRKGKPACGGEVQRRNKLLSFLDNYTWIKSPCTNYRINDSMEGDSAKEDTQDNNDLYMIHVTEDAEDPLSDKVDSFTYSNGNNSEDDCKNDEDYEVTGSTKKELKLKRRRTQYHSNQIKRDGLSIENDSYNSEEDCKHDEEYNETEKNLKRNHRQAQETLNQILQSTEYKMQRNPSTENNWDETDLFFSSIAKIVKKLPRQEQIELRMKIGTLVGSTELRYINHNSMQPSTSGTFYPEVSTGQKTTEGTT